MVGQECLQLMQRFKGGLLGEGHSWVAAPAPLPAAEPAPVPVRIEERVQPTAIAGPSSALAAADVEAQILELVQQYIPEVDPRRPLAEQGLDSLAALELRQKIQAATGLELMTLIEDPQGASVAAIAQEVAATAAAAAPAQAMQRDEPGMAMQPRRVQTSAVQAVAGPLWVSPAPVSVKMRIFCLPYAGGVSENVFAR